MPILSEAGTDREDILINARKYALEFDAIGAKMISDVPARNRNIKVNLVTEAIFHKGNKHYDINNSEFYGRAEKVVYPTVERILSILKMPDSREVFGLTYRDLIEMDDATLDYVNNQVYEMYKERVKIQQEQEKLLHDK